MNPGRATKTDKLGRPFEVGMISSEDIPSLLEMYRIFSPKPASQGVPPNDPEACYTWVRKLLEIGENFLAWRSEYVIGHAVLIHDLKGKSGEFVIFVEQNNRNLGVGTELTRFTVDRYRHLGFDSIWLTVDLLNFQAVKLYKKIGFKYSDMDTYERIMMIKLN